MKSIAVATLSLAGAVAIAGAGYGAYRVMTPPTSGYATVTKVDPIVKRWQEPRETCQDVTVTRQKPVKDEHRVTGSVVGAVIGGVIGHQFGGGSGKKALTVVGALAGASIARDAARRNQESRYPTKVCHTTIEKEVVEDISAYDVTYEYGGQQFSKRMSTHPGETVRVRVQVSPVLYGN